MSEIRLLKFGADWCGPCKMLNPVLEELKEEMKDVAFEFIDVDKKPEVAAEYGVMSIPAVFILKDEEIKASFNGYKPKDFIIEEIEEVKGD